MALNDSQTAFLREVAERYVWWKTPEEALAYPQRILAQVMNIGVWDDLCRMVELFPSWELVDVLRHAEIGQFNERSWHFWHNRLSRKIPPMPKRVLQ